MPQVRNPILPGFNPDPSVLRVGDDYYIATSTFEWYPGVQIHHSKDLANWTLVSPRPLNRASQLDMRGDPDSCGVWAPCLTHDGDKFYLVYTDVKRKDGDFKDTHNYIVTADKAEGPWSDPIYTTSSGFDPSLFHDPDTGKKWFVNMICDHRRRPQFFEGIILQEFDPKKGALVGPRKNIFRGTELNLVEGPHLYKRNGYYYILTAEGGTAYGHACTLARSRDVWGPYEVAPNNPIVTSKNSPFAAIQRAGHGDIVDTPDGKTYLVHLGGRPITQERRCVLGRETSIQEAEWHDDDWLYVKNGPIPSLHVEVPGTRDEDKYWAEQRYTFSAPSTSSTPTTTEDRDTAADNLHPDFQWLRTPLPSRIFSLSDTPGALTLYGREAPGSWFEQALVARRQTHFSYDASTVLSPGYYPDDVRQFAGLTAYYCRFNFFYLAVAGTNDDFDDESLMMESRGDRELLIMQSEGSFPHGKLERPMAPPIRLPNRKEFDGRIKLSLEIRGKALQFFYALEDVSAGGTNGKNEIKWSETHKIGPVLDASILSDECGGHQAHGSFTGAFVGVAASDINGFAMPARFEEFVYRPVKHESDRYEI